MISISLDGDDFLCSTLKITIEGSLMLLKSIAGLAGFIMIPALKSFLSACTDLTLDEEFDIDAVFDSIIETVEEFGLELEAGFEVSGGSCLLECLGIDLSFDFSLNLDFCSFLKAAIKAQLNILLVALGPVIMVIEAAISACMLLEGLFNIDLGFDIIGDINSKIACLTGCGCDCSELIAEFVEILESVGLDANGHFVFSFFDVFGELADKLNSLLGIRNGIEAIIEAIC